MVSGSWETEDCFALVHEKLIETVLSSTDSKGMVDAGGLKTATVERTAGLVTCLGFLAEEGPCSASLDSIDRQLRLHF